MENASKALLIAGGVLLAMMILAILVNLIGNVNDMAESKERTKETKQIAEFNASYLAYNKSRMYGTDVITVVNKAIDHNKTIGVIDTDPYYINITFTVKETFQTTEQEITIMSNGTKIEGDIHKQIGNVVIKEGIQYSLLKGDEANPTIDEKVIEFFSNNSVVDITDEIVMKDKSKIVYKNTYSALTNFKRAIFKCTNVTYDENTGRIKNITFEQI